MQRKLNIAFVTDFYYPYTGGIETHIRYLSKFLIKRGHKVIVITHSKSNMEDSNEFNDIKVYALDFPVISMNTTFPTLFSNFLVFKKIFEIESIDIVHGHQTMSNLCIESIFHGRTLDIPTIVTEHSLFEEGPLENIVVNKLCKFVLKPVDRIICVSQTSKQNIFQRLEVDRSRIHVIPNAVISDKFYPKKSKEKTKRLIIMSRLVYRKGIDLIIKAIPIICRSDKEIQIFVAGSGPKKDELEQMVDENNLRSRVHIMGDIPHSSVGDFLRTGDVFLNTSLTETFCLAILEAAMCRLHVISTNVGAIHEVLPREIITFCKPTSEDIAIKVLEKINGNYSDPSVYYEFLKTKYSWEFVAGKTEELYLNIKRTKMSPRERMNLYGHMFEHFLIIIEYLWLYILIYFGN